MMSADEIRMQMVERAARAAEVGWEALVAAEVESVPPRPREAWPIPIRAIATARRPGDRGVGDTVARVVGAFGGRVVEEWWEAVFDRPCGCADRRAWLNGRYPYEGGDA